MSSDLVACKFCGYLRRPGFIRIWGGSIGLCTACTFRGHNLVYGLIWRIAKLELCRHKTVEAYPW